MDKIKIKRYKDVYSNGKDQDIRTFYEQEMQWARHFNQIIWVTFSVLLPVSLAGLTQYGELEKEPYLCVAAASIILLLTWHRLAEGHRRLWKHRLDNTDAIEVVWGVRLEDESDEKPKGKPGMVQSTRVWAVRFAITVWVISVVIKWYEIPARVMTNN